MEGMAFLLSQGVRFSIVGTRASPKCRQRKTWWPRKTITSVQWHPTSESILSPTPRPVSIALTREKGKNEALYNALNGMLDFCELKELPCVETVKGPDREQLDETLREQRFDWIVITSPEAADIFIHSWRAAGYPTLNKIAAVGRATGDRLRAVGVHVNFEPTKATGKTLVAEIPKDETRDADEQGSVLYPASLKASGDIVSGLTKLGFTVTRLNTYSTETTEFDDLFKEMGVKCDIVTFASPSAVRAWVANVGVHQHTAVACIGETSAKAAREAGFSQVHYAEKPGLEGWVMSIMEAMKLFEAGKTGPEAADKNIE